MEIIEQDHGDALELSVSGRLDSYWADHLTTRLRAVIQQGHHHLRLDLSKTTYLSSAGIGILMECYKQLSAIRGSFGVRNPSPQVKRILEISGLTQLLLHDKPEPKPAVTISEVRRLERDGVEHLVYELAPGEILHSTLIGTPGRLAAEGRFSPDHAKTISLAGPGFALGLGALGSEFETCRRRYGEFLAVAGAAAYLPTDGANTAADYLVGADNFAPDVSVLYGIDVRGQFAHFLRFETSGDGAPATLENLAEAALTASGADAVGMVVVAESRGLMGAALRKSPALEDASGSLFDFPGIRDWLSFTPERVHIESVALVVGVAARNGASGLDSMLRPISAGSAIGAHFHAAVFSYGPLQRGRVELRGTVAKLFETQRLRAVLHLLNDDRPVVGVGQSEFTRGACWAGPLEPAAPKSESP